MLHSHRFRNTLPPLYGSCDEVHGSSTGDFWPVAITKESNVSLFIPDFCRYTREISPHLDSLYKNANGIWCFSSIKLYKVGDHKVSSIEGVKFEGNNNTFDNGKQFADKECEDCPLDSGVRDLSSRVPAPVFVSFPHFYAADANYLKHVNGLQPVRDLHAFHLTFQKVRINT